MENNEQQDGAETILTAAFDMAERIEKLERVNAELCIFIEKLGDALPECTIKNQCRAMVAASKAVLG